MMTMMMMTRAMLVISSFDSRLVVDDFDATQIIEIDRTQLL